MNMQPATETRLHGTNIRSSFDLDEFVAAGGEGRVYTVRQRPGVVAKLYPRPMEAAKAKKLAIMIQSRTDQIANIAAWPIDVLRSRSKAPVGFLMPYYEESLPLHVLLNPKSRLKHRSDLTYSSLVRIAQNVASAVSTLHRAGIIVGDINGQNFRVLANGTVRAIDCDSMQISSDARWLEGVGVEDYTAPELQGKSLRGVRRTREHDNFALAVLLFEILVLGRHPFGGNGDTSIGEAIKSGRHVFAANGSEKTIFQIIGLKPTDVLTPEIIDLFGRAFAIPKSSVFSRRTSRPDAGDWAVALSDLANQLEVCFVDPAHHYPNPAVHCPWCALVGRGMQPMFTPKPVVVETRKNDQRSKNCKDSEPIVAQHPISKWVGKFVRFCVRNISEIAKSIQHTIDVNHGGSVSSFLKALVDDIVATIVYWTKWALLLAIGSFALFVVLKISEAGA